MKKRRPLYRHPLVDVGLLVGLATLALAPASRGCTSTSTSTSSSAAAEAARPPLQRRTGEPPRPPQTPLPGAIKITGGERLQWEQEGQSLDQVRQWRYVVAIGLARREIKNAKCGVGKNPKGPFVCSGDLPELDRGNHQLRVIAIDRENGREWASPWSRPIAVFKE